MLNEPQAVFGCGEWSENEKELLGIVVLEGLAVLFTLLCVGPMVGGAQVVLQSDNAGVVFMLLKEHSRDPRLCALLQAIVAVQELYGYRVVLGHTSTRFMGEPDDLSRGVAGRAVPTSTTWGMERVPDVALGAASFMRRVREFTARGKPGARSRSSAVGVFNRFSDWIHGGESGLLSEDVRALCAVPSVGCGDQRTSAQACDPLVVDTSVVAPSDGGEVWNFVRYCFDVRGVAPKTIEGYVSSVVKHARVQQGRLLVVPQLYRDWMARLKQVPVTSRAKQPVSRQFLLEVVGRVRTSLATRVAVTMAYFTGMRLGELVASKVGEYDVMFTVTRGDMSFDDAGRYVKFTNRGGKSDVLNKGEERFLMAAGEGAVFCPVRFLRQLWDLDVDAPASTPFLQHEDGRMVTRRHVVDLLKRVAVDLGMDPTKVAGHTLRISAATHLAEDGVALSEIQIFGGWLTPEVCLRYLRWTDTRLQRMSAALTLRPGPMRASEQLGMAMAVEEAEPPEDS